jgi:PAS domain S-box-containing protein
VNIYAYAPTIALLINVFVTAYIFAQKRKNSLNNSYLYYLINISFWILFDIILRQNILSEYITLSYKFTSIFWLSVGIWFLNFSYEFTGKNRDRLFGFFVISTILSITVSFNTPFLIKEYEIINRGIDEEFGSLFLLILVVSNLIPVLYGLYLIFKKTYGLENIHVKKSAWLIIAGTILAIATAIFINISLPYIFDFRNSFRLAESVSIIQTIFIFAAIARYKLFNFGIEDLSYNLFSSMKDAVVITDDSMRIIHSNNSAQELFGLYPNYQKSKQLNETLPDIHKLEENDKEERKLNIGNEQRYILITKNKIIQNNKSLGYMFYITDITLRKIAEQNLFDSEKNFSQLFESSPDAIVVVDTDGKMLQVNREAENIFGYSRNELLGKEISFLIPQRYRNSHDKQIDKYKTNPKKRRMGDGLDLYGLRKDGSEFSVDIMLSPISQQDKKLTLCTVRDVTDIKIIEQKLKHNEEQYRNIFQTHPHGIVETTLDGTITLANNAYAHIYEFKVEEIIGKKVWEIHDDKEFINNAKKFFKVLNDGTSIPQSVTSIRTTKTGKRIEVQIDWDFKRDTDNNPIGYIKIVTDITEKKRAERNLNQQRLMLTQAEGLAHLGSWKFNIKTGELFWSDELFRIYGEDKNTFEPTFEEYRKRIHPEDRINVFKEIEEAINEGLPFSQVERIIRPDGEIRILSSNGVPQKNDSGEVIGLFGSCLDVTEYKKIERELLISQIKLRALSANQQATREEERTKLAREIHDEFGQILTAVNMDIGFLINELVHNQNTNKEIFFSNLESVERLIEKAIKTIQNIATELRPDVLDHLGLIPALMWQLKEFEKRYSIETKLEKSVASLEIEDDKKIALFRIFQESLTNVARHSKATKVTAVLSRNNDTFEMRVIDNGIGISKEKLDSIKSIGLIGIKERMVLLNGEVYIKTAPHKGTELHIKVPIK